MESIELNITAFFSLSFFGGGSCVFNAKSFSHVDTHTYLFDNVFTY